MDDPQRAEPQAEPSRPWVAQIERQLRELDAIDEHAAEQLRERRGEEGASVVYAIRLDRREMATLKRKAASLGLRPSVLARNLIRVGLTTKPPPLSEAVDRLEDAVAELRTLVQ